MPRRSRVFLLLILLLAVHSRLVAQHEATEHPARDRYGKTSIAAGLLIVLPAGSGEDLEAIFQSYDLSCSPKFPQLYAVPRLKKGEEEGYLCTVPLGHESAWVEILESHDAVRTTRWLEWVIPSDSDVTPPLPGYKLAMGPFRSSEGSDTAPDPIDAVAAFFKRSFERKGTIAETKRSPKRVRFVASHLRGEVIRGKAYWERLEIDAAVLGAKKHFQVLVVLDGYFASGTGDTEPPLGRYEDMSANGYHRELEEYLGRLVTGITGFFQKGAQQ